MRNDNGNITSIGLVFLLSIISIGSISIIKKSNDIKRHKKVLSNFLCVKEAHGLISHHKKLIEMTNTIITLANLGQMVGLVTNPALMVGAKKAKYLTQKAQDIYHISFLKNLGSIFSQTCIFTPNVAKTHFETTAVVKLKRSTTGVVSKRRTKWGFSTYNDSSSISSSLNSNSVTTKTNLY